MPDQIILVATLTPPATTIEDYLSSPQWQTDRPGFVIGRDGTIHGGHGRQSVIALANVGELVKKGNTWLPVSGNTGGSPVNDGNTGGSPVNDGNTGGSPVNDGNTGGSPVNYIPYEYCSCSKVFEMIPDRQLNALRRLLKSLLSQFHIQFPYDNQLGRVCPRAIAGRPGIWFASSFDSHRLDIHPQIELINLIKSLAS